MRKQMIAAGLLTGMLLSVVPVMADDTTTTQTITGSSASCSVMVTGGASEFVVTIPKTLSYNGTSGTIPYKVTVSGDISGDEQLHVVPDASFELIQNRKGAKTATVTQDRTTWNADELAEVGNGSISYADLSSGSWTGAFNFHIELKSLFGADVTLEQGNLSTYGIATTGDVIVPDVVVDADGIKHKVTAIGNNAFRDSGLTSIVIPSGVTSIGSYAFSGCSSLTSIELPEGITSIPSFMCWRCGALTDVNIPDGVTEIKDNAFNNCPSLVRMDLPNGLTYIGTNAFWSCSNLESVRMPDSVTTIKSGVFIDCRKLSDVTIPSGLTELEASIFYDCFALTDITIPDTVTKIGDNTFYKCTGLTSITIPENVTTIGKNAFYECTGVSEIGIPTGVTRIGENAFKDVTHITYSGSATGSPWGAKGMN